MNVRNVMKHQSALWSLLALPAFMIPLSSCTGDNVLTIAEVTHSIFYAPQYVAIENGYFKEEGLNVELLSTPGADKTMAALLSGEADIGLMGKSPKLERQLKYPLQSYSSDNSCIIPSCKTELFSL